MSAVVCVGVSCQGVMIEMYAICMLKVMEMRKGRERERERERCGGRGGRVGHLRRTGVIINYMSLIPLDAPWLPLIPSCNVA